jgi:hypothetical protein
MTLTSTPKAEVRAAGFRRKNVYALAVRAAPGRLSALSVFL